MSREIKEILSEPDDSDVCSKLLTRLVARYREQIDLARVSEPERIVLAVWHATGIIQNGGFHYLFSASFDGDPDYRLTAEAFTAIGCEPAATAFHRAFELFDDGLPPADIDRRLHEYLRGHGARRTEIDKLFWSAADDVARDLAAYIRSQEATFAALDDEPTTTIEAPSSDASKNEPDDEPRLIDQITGLPHWSRVALAARCARYLLPIFQLNWPNANSKRLATVVRCIALAEQSASQGRMAAGVPAAITDGLVAVGAAMCAVRSVMPIDEPLPMDGNTGVTAASAAKVALNACEAAAEMVEILVNVFAGYDRHAQNVTGNVGSGRRGGSKRSSAMLGKAPGMPKPARLRKPASNS